MLRTDCTSDGGLEVVSAVGGSVASSTVGVGVSIVSVVIETVSVLANAVELEVKFRGISLVMAIPVTLSAVTLSSSALNTRDWLVHGGESLHASQYTLPPRGFIHKLVLNNSIDMTDKRHSITSAWGLW